MRSKTLNTSSLSWDSSLEVFQNEKKPSVNLEKLISAGIHNLHDLMWILPLRIHRTPKTQSFTFAQIGGLFRGRGKIIHCQISPAFGRRFKGKFIMFNGHLVIKDDYGPETLSLRWFNLYPNQKKQLESMTEIEFLGTVQDYRAQKQIVNPQVIAPESDLTDYLIEYPTINKVSGNYTKKYIEQIPSELWNNISPTLPQIDYEHVLKLSEAFKILHGRYPVAQFTPDLRSKAEERLAYEEFLQDQLKILTRRKYIKRKDATKFVVPEKILKKYLIELPFSLTEDQTKVLHEIIEDLGSGHPMMRMIQGDVGCGKTIVAFIVARIISEQSKQVALMCPTEALAQQHYKSFQELIEKFKLKLKIGLLLGSTKAKEKKEISKSILNGEIHLLIGTHSLFQDSVKFQDLGLVIIDEQHKFGVEQRLKLVAKGNGVHCLIMTATPIPRTLSLAHYGDLDMSFIRTMPAGRKGIKTRITEVVNYDKYLQFVATRLSQGEQAYFVFPAIEESETTDLKNVKESIEKYKKLFPQFKVEMLHGQMKADEKEAVLELFYQKKIHILVSTSVIEVGINNPNATIMSIYHPERFGLSSLHQLRGRVGRGEKPGFCFLVLDRDLSPEAQERLKVIENSTDGFVIAEEDLKFRGEGDLFGVDQSGTVTSKKVANFLTHGHILEKVIVDLKKLENEHAEVLSPILEKLAKDQKILDTI
ncbi:MAG: ATP-dependent DNA helicase RecG [Bacteriovoracaceae bacterium]